MSKTTNFMLFIFGAAVGSIATWTYTKKKYERIAQEEIDSVKEVFARREKSEVEVVNEKEPQTKETGDADYENYEKEVEDSGYTTYPGGRSEFTAPDDEDKEYFVQSLFSKEDIEFADMCETKAVTSSLYLDMNEGMSDVTEYESLKTLREKIDKKGTDDISKKDLAFVEKLENLSNEELDAKIAEGHKYIFVGKVGSFCPIKPECGGGLLMREKDGKYYAATGSKGYRWLESEMVKELDKESDIDRSYYDNMATEAINTISQ